MQERAVRWIIALAITAVAIAIPVLFWRAWSEAAVPTAKAPNAVVGKRAKKLEKANRHAAAGKGDAAEAQAPAGAQAGAAMVYFDQNGRPLARFAVLRLTDPADAGGAAPAGQRFVDATIVVQNVSSAPLHLPASMFRVRDADGGLHQPIGDAAPAAPRAEATPAAGKRAARPAKRNESAKSARPGATPRAGGSDRTEKARGAAPKAGGASIDLASGQTQTVNLRFAVPASAAIASILVAPDQNRLVSLAVLPPQAAPSGKSSAKATPAAATPTAAGDRHERAAKPTKTRTPAKTRTSSKT